MWPIRFTTVEQMELADPVGTVTVTREKPLEHIDLVSSRTLVGASFWTVRAPKTSHDAWLELRITNADTKEVVHFQVERFSDVFDGEQKKLRFLFPSLYNSSGRSYLVSLRLQSAAADESLMLRGTLTDPDDFLSAHAAIQFMETRSLLSLFYTHLYLAKTDGEDIYYYWVRGGQVADGGNPYECALDDTCVDHKNPGHFPLFYWLSAFSHYGGLHEYETWIAFWRPVFILFYIATGVLLFSVLYKRKQYELALFALFFWLFNRWSLYVIRVAHVDFLAVFFMTASLLLFEKRRYWSLLFLGVSLAIKQVAVFLIPLYIILGWVRTRKDTRWKNLLLAVALIGYIPLITALPFLLDNPRAVAKGLLFSASRSSHADMGAMPLVSLLKMHGAVGVAPMVFLMALIYGAAYRRHMTVVTGGFAIMVIFLAFNTVLFNQYFLWVIPFIPLVLAQLRNVEKEQT